MSPLAPAPAAFAAGMAAAALDALPDGVLVVADDQVLLVNAALCRMAGAETGELVGHPVPASVQRLTTETVDCVLPDGRAAELITVRNRAAQTAREETLLRLANRDGLTGLLNKRTFMRRMVEEAEALGREDRPLALVMVDLDHFKLVNDRHGHPVGDRVLAEAARRLARTARTVDIVGRFGGEEFAWLLPDATPGEALAAAHRLAAALRSQPFADGIELTASIGICDLVSAGSAERMLERADAALYWAKAHGRDAVLGWTASAARRLAAVAGSAEGATREARLARLADVADAVDTSVGAGHGRRVADLAIALAARLDWAPDQQARLHQAALLHDLGKAVLPPDMLAKPARLDGPETAHVRQHAAIGAAMAGAALDAEQCAWIRGHHERIDGTGYPDAAAGAQIPAGARLIALADAWDAMTHDRPHQPALPDDLALEEIDRSAGTQLLPGAGALLRDAVRWWATD